MNVTLVIFKNSIINRLDYICRHNLASDNLIYRVKLLSKDYPITQRDMIEKDYHLMGCFLVI